MNVIHRFWGGPRVPDPRDVAFGKMWEDLGYEVVEWDGVPEWSGPLAPYEECYEAAYHWAMKSDIARLALVYLHGGIYADFDVEPRRRLDPLIGDSKAWCTVDTAGLPSQWLFGAVPNHESMLALLSVIPERMNMPYPQSTAPLAFEAALERHPGVMDVVGTDRSASPIYCDARHDFQNEGLMAEVRADPEVYAIHHWRWSWQNDV